MVPDTAKDAAISLAAAVDPLAVMVLLTVPCCTVVVSWVAELAVDAVGGLMTKYTPTIAAIATSPKEPFRIVRLLNCMSTSWPSGL